MKRFLKRIILFVFGLILYFGVNYLINHIIISNSNPDIKARTLISGDSHLKLAIDPSLFDNAENISQGAEPYIITYWKLKKILESNKIDTLIFGFSPHNISAFNDLKFSQKKWALEMFKRTYIIQNFKSIPNIEIDYLKFYKVVFQNTCFYPVLNPIKYIGGYNPVNIIDLTDSESSIKRHYYFNNKKLGFSKTAISYLDSLIQECKSSSIVPIFLSPPVHRIYYEQIPIEILEKFHKKRTELINKGIMVLGNTSDYLPDSLYYDFDHLNKSGSKVFTRKILQNIHQKETFKTID